MTISMYDITIPVWKHFLGNLSVLMDKAVAYADAKKIEHTVLLNARLYPDMFALTRQVQVASDHAKNAGARLAGIEAPKFADDETTFAELQVRIHRTITFLDTITPQQLEGSENREIVLLIHDTRHEMKGLQYLLNLAQPNFYFHVTTAYGILRHNGVEIGKRDFLG